MHLPEDPVQKTSIRKGTSEEFGRTYTVAENTLNVDDTRMQQWYKSFNLNSSKDDKNNSQSPFSDFRKGISYKIKLHLFHSIHFYFTQVYF